MARFLFTAPDQALIPKLARGLLEYETLSADEIRRIIRGEKRDDNLTLLAELCDTMKFGSLCALGGLTPLPVLSAIGFAMLMFTAGTHVDVGSPAIRQGFARGVLALAVVAVTAVPIGLLLDHTLAVGHPALIAVIVTGSSAAIAFPIIEERKLAGPNVAFLIAWVALADSVTVVIMPLTLAKSGSPLEAIGGDATIIVVGVLALLAASRLRSYGVLEQMRDESLQRG